jgi:hypothetical protein
VLTPARMVVPVRTVERAPLTVARRRVEPTVALTVVRAGRVARVPRMAARGRVEPMVAPTVALVDWAATAKVWLMAGPRRAQVTAEPMVEQTAALVAEGSSGSW